MLCPLHGSLTDEAFCALQSLSDASDDTTADATDMTVQQSDDWPHCSFDWDSAQVHSISTPMH